MQTSTLPLQITTPGHSNTTVHVLTTCRSTSSLHLTSFPSTNININITLYCTSASQHTNCIFYLPTFPSNFSCLCSYQVSSGLGFYVLTKRVCIPSSLPLISPSHLSLSSLPLVPPSGPSLSSLPLVPPSRPSLSSLPLVPPSRPSLPRTSLCLLLSPLHSFLPSLSVILCRYIRCGSDCKWKEWMWSAKAESHRYEGRREREEGRERRGKKGVPFFVKYLNFLFFPSFFCFPFSFIYRCLST